MLHALFVAKCLIRLEAVKITRSTLFCSLCALGLKHIVPPVDADILLLGDKSISRKHAVLHHEYDAAQRESKMFVTDYSQYGTHVDGTTVENGTRLPIQQGSKVKFGASDTLIRIKSVPVVLCLSGFAEKEKSRITQDVEELGALRPQIKSKPNECHTFSLV